MRTLGPGGGSEFKFRFGYEDLGPAVADYLARLHILAQTFEQDRASKTLFVARGGVRIRRALDTFTKAAHWAPLENVEFFWVSRLMAAKGVWNRDRDAAIQIMSEEFRNAPLAAFVRAMFHFSPRGANLKPMDRDLLASGDHLGSFMQSSHEMARLLRTFFEHQSRLFEAYVNTLMGGATTALLIDTGWQGRTQSLLTRGFPEIDWWGAYFGVTNLDGPHRAQMMGVAFEADKYDVRRPETCVVLNRHMMESVFEPRGNSIEWLAEERPGIVVAPDAQSNLNATPTTEFDPIYCGVLAYLANLESANPVELRERACEAWHRIARIAIHPTLSDLKLFEGIYRCADFGRETRAPLVMPPVPRFAEDTSALRISEALWPCGQATAEVSADVAVPLQRKLAGIADASDEAGLAL